MKKLPHILALIALVVILLLYGCGGLPTATNWPKKRVMVMNARDLTGLGMNRTAETVSEGLADHLKKTGLFNVFRNNTAKQSLSFEPGEPIPQDLLRNANGMGMNTIIFETINPIEITPTTSVLWPFRKKAQRFSISLNIDIVDVTKGTILLSKEFTHSTTAKSEGTEDENESLLDKETIKRILREQLPKVIAKAAKAASNSLNQEMWTGTIVSVDAQNIIVNAGRDAGLRPGVVFEVYDYGESITSYKGQIYHLPGKKVGEIETIQIQSQHSVATPLTSSDFKPGQIVRIKD